MDAQRLQLASRTTEGYHIMDDPLDDELVSQRDRISVDVSDIREQVESCRDDVAWSELPLASKLRVLIKERLAQLEAEKKQKKEDSKP